MIYGLVRSPIVGFLFLLTSVAFAAGPEMTPRQREIADQYSKLLDGAAALTPSDFSTYFDHTISFVRTLSGEDRDNELLFVLLLGEFVPSRLKDQADQWRRFVQDQVDRRLRVPADAPDERFLRQVDAALAGAAARATGATAETIAIYGHKLDEIHSREPMLASLEIFEDRYLGLLENRDRDAAAARETRFTESPNPGVRKVARGRLAVAKSKVEAVEMHFTAVDGREVDLAKLRGKVVLVDFWATWCGPCIAELPNVRSVYEKYHERGFEVVGISVESANLRAGDTPEERAEKLAKARDKLVAFTNEKKLPWPQFFDGEHWKNPFIIKYGIMGIPAMFLLDKDGRVVETNARGEKLEAEVKRLLAL